MRKLSTAWVDAVRAAPIHARMVEMGLVPAGDPFDAFAAMLRTDTPVWGKAIQDGGITID